MNIRQQAGQDEDHGNGCCQGADRSHSALQRITLDTPLLRWLRLRASSWYLCDTGRQYERARQLRLRHGVDQGDGAAQFPKDTLAALAAL